MDAGAPSAYSGITETPGVGATREQLRMLSTRYEFAARHVAGGRVLEVASGTGIGLGYLKAKGAAEVVGCDIDPVNVHVARTTYSERPGIKVVQDDAHALASVGTRFDVIACFEAIYYFENLNGFLARCAELLNADGTLIICSVNPAWSGFSSSPFARHYWTPNELAPVLARAGFKSVFFGAFPDTADGLKAKIVAALRRAAVRWGFMPRTMRGKVLLKRIFLGGTAPMPNELTTTNALPVEPLRPIRVGDPLPYKVFYVAANRV